MANLNEQLQAALAGYEGKALNGYSFITRNVDETLFTVVSIGTVRGETVIDTGLVVRFAGEQIVIEHDINDKPLVDVLLGMGIPRQQIVLAYIGEPIENAAYPL